ncbi:elongation factor [Psychromonas sp. CNPT3]|uniref:YigZ family protein n=1 Tax=Psychromonas sp. CNPT3 TaxID=314282 RepID=UPI00006E5056|nr:YigZ family protein [Psychromonas sp. CNPT3]AGH82439.1 elongation factor [Psychromonas sp. CNPT3]
MLDAYPILTQDLSYKEEIKKSRFITYLMHALGKEQAMLALQKIKRLHPDARHYCWAYIAGSPNDSVQMGCNDDGEPKGTAGKPMLSLIQGAKIGEVLAVVVRYSGGIKLGTGGLVHAYSNGIRQLIKTMQVQEKCFYAQYKLQCDHGQMALIENVLKDYSAHIVDIEYTYQVDVILAIDVRQCASFLLKIASLTQGKVYVTKITDTVE